MPVACASACNRSIFNCRQLRPSRDSVLSHLLPLGFGSGLSVEATDLPAFRQAAAAVSNSRTVSQKDLDSIDLTGPLSGHDDGCESPLSWRRGHDRGITSGDSTFYPPFNVISITD